MVIQGFYRGSFLIVENGKEHNIEHDMESGHPKPFFSEIPSFSRTHGRFALNQCEHPL